MSASTMPPPAASSGDYTRFYTTPAQYIFVESNKFTRDLANPELEQLAGRFSPTRGKCGEGNGNRALLGRECFPSQSTWVSNVSGRYTGDPPDPPDEDLQSDEECSLY